MNPHGRKSLPGDCTRESERNENAGKSLPFKIPMAYVVSEAAELCSEAKFAKKMEQLERAYRIDESCKGMRGRSNDQTLMDMASACVAGKKIRKSNQENPHSYRTPWFQEYEENCERKRPRRQPKVSQQTRARKIASIKRRPLASSNQEIWFVNKDTTSAIVSSQIIVQKVLNKSKGTKGTSPTLASAISQMKKMKNTKPKHYVGNVPRFTSIPNEFQGLCQNKSVEKIMYTKHSGQDFNEFQKSDKNRDSSVNQALRKTGCKLRNSNDTKATTGSSIRQHNVDKKQGFSKAKSSCYSQFVRTFDNMENIQVPKNIYIRKETGDEITEDLVEVRNQDDLDVLNTLKTLKSEKNKHCRHTETAAVKYFEDLQDYETYYYPPPKSPRGQYSPA